MKTYLGTEIRNVAVMGHAQSGKTTLIAALLQAAKMTQVQGRVADGTAVTAYDEEEILRGTTMQNAVAFAEWQGVKVNLIDTPGSPMFAHEARAAMLPVEAALVLVNAQCGVEPVTERVWGYAAEANLPRIVVLNQMDSPRAGGGQGLSALMEDLHERWGRTCVPVQLPITGPEGFHGVVDLVTMQAFFYELNGKGVSNGQGRIGEVPAGVLGAARAAHEALVELVAEGKDELMEEFFREGTIPEQHLITALHEAIREDRIFPVLFASGAANVGTDHLLDFLKVYAPSAAERAPMAVTASPHESVGMEAVTSYGDAGAVAVSGSGGSNGGSSKGHGGSSGSGGNGGNMDSGIVLRPIKDSEPVALFVFKTMNDASAGRVSFFKVISGVVKTDMMVENYTHPGQERLSHLSAMQGRKAVEVMELHAGDLGAVAKLRETFTGDALGLKGSEIRIEAEARPEPSVTYAIEPKSRADEDKLAAALHKLMEEDQMMRLFRAPETHEFLVAGAGQQHIEAVVSRLKRRYHCEVTLKAAQDR